MTNDKEEELNTKVVSTIRICLADKVMYYVMNDESTANTWFKLESLYMSKFLTNKLSLKKKLYGLKMAEGADLTQHVNTFREGKHRSKGNKPREAISYRKVPTLVQKCSYFVPIYITAVPGAFQSYQDKSFDLRCHVWMLPA